MKYVDLHIHTTASDGSFSSAAVVTMAKEAGYAAIAVTDHDNTGGLPEAIAAGARLGVEVVPGIELSTAYAGGEVHILGYFIDPTADSLSDLLETALLHREERNTRICAVLRAAGIDVTMEELRAKFPGAVLGRPHIGHGAKRVCQRCEAGVPGVSGQRGQVLRAQGEYAHGTGRQPHSAGRRPAGAGPSVSV